MNLILLVRPDDILRQLNVIAQRLASFVNLCYYILHVRCLALYILLGINTVEQVTSLV